MCVDIVNEWVALSLMSIFIEQLLDYHINLFFYNYEYKRIEEIENFIVVDKEQLLSGSKLSFEKVLKEVEKALECTLFIKMKDLGDFLNNKIGIPLPKLLFPEKPINKNSRPNQKAKVEARTIAKELWAKDPSITITDMTKHQKIIECTKRANGSFYLDKTVYDWIKDLCPNRSPGRREKKD